MKKINYVMLCIILFLLSSCNTEVSEKNKTVETIKVESKTEEPKHELIKIEGKKVKQETVKIEKVKENIEEKIVEKPAVKEEDKIIRF